MLSGPLRFACRCQILITPLHLVLGSVLCNLQLICYFQSRISLFSGWLREAYGPGFLEAFAPQLLIRKMFVYYFSHFLSPICFFS